MEHEAQQQFFVPSQLNNMPDYFGRAFVATSIFDATKHNWVDDYADTAFRSRKSSVSSDLGNLPVGDSDDSINSGFCSDDDIDFKDDVNESSKNFLQEPVILDSGCSTHMAPEHLQLQDERQIQTSVRFGISSAPVTSIGNLSLTSSLGKTFAISDVLKVQGLSVVLLSMYQLYCSGYISTLDNRGALFSRKAEKWRQYRCEMAFTSLIHQSLILFLNVWIGLFSLTTRFRTLIQVEHLADHIVFSETLKFWMSC